MNIFKNFKFMTHFTKNIISVLSDIQILKISRTHSSHVIVTKLVMSILPKRSVQRDMDHENLIQTSYGKSETRFENFRVWVFQKSRNFWPSRNFYTLKNFDENQKFSKIAIFDTFSTNMGAQTPKIDVSRKFRTFQDVLELSETNPTHSDSFWAHFGDFRQKFEFYRISAGEWPEACLGLQSCCFCKLGCQSFPTHFESSPYLIQGRFWCKSKIFRKIHFSTPLKKIPDQ